MVSDSVESRICTCCDLRRDIQEFRRFRKDSEERHSQCNECRRVQEQLKREKKTQQEIRATMRELRRSRTLERMMSFIDQLASRLGGKNKLIDLWVGLLQNENTPSTFRVATARTLLYAAVCADARQAAERLEVLRLEEPVDAVRKLHESGRLFPGLQEMYYQGEFTWDEILNGIDPPPC